MKTAPMLKQELCNMYARACCEVLNLPERYKYGHAPEWFFTLGRTIIQVPLVSAHQSTLQRRIQAMPEDQQTQLRDAIIAAMDEKDMAPLEMWYMANEAR
jgi:hypothetical protein